MKAASGRSGRSRSVKTSDPAGPTQAPSAYGRLPAGELVKTQSAELSTATHRFGPQHSLLRLTLIRGYGQDEGARRFDALEKIREHRQFDADKVRAVYSTLFVHVDAAIDRRLLQPLAARRETEQHRLTKALTTFTTWYRGHLPDRRNERQQVLPQSLLLQAVDTLLAALDHDPLMSMPIDARFKRPVHRQLRKETERARQSLRAWGIGNQDANHILKCVGLTGPALPASRYRR